MLVFTRYPDQNFTWFTLKSIVTVDEWINTLNDYGNQGLTKYELYDLQNAPIDAEQFTSEDINKIVSLASINSHLRPPNGKSAIVAKENVVFGLSRMFSLLSEMEASITWETNVFDSLAEAVAWLGKDVEKIILGK